MPTVSRERLALLLICAAGAAHAAVTPELQHAIRDNTFEVVMKKPEPDPVKYEKPLPLDLLPYIERTDAYRSVGTAFALGHNTYVTAAHVIVVGVNSQFGPPALRRSDGTVYKIDRILRFSQHQDFVVFSLQNDPAPAGLVPDTNPKLDEPVLAIGNALGEGVVIRDGLYTSETPEQQDGRWKWIRFSAAASPGNSGGPLCDADGHVIGIVIGKSPNENLNYSLPIALVLDADMQKARFDLKMLISLPYMHGTYTYSYKDDFNLPLSWPAFVEAYRKTVERHSDESRVLLKKNYADTLFPKGPGTESLLYQPAESALLPRLITQQADGTWVASSHEEEKIDLPGDGAVRVADAAGAKILSIVRSDGASDDAFYGDSKAFMDLALKALNLRRTVGPDQVRVVSLGAAKSDGVFVDPYGRKWQERVWAIPFLDAYVAGELLPTPDGYAAILFMAPSSIIYDAKALAQLFTGQFDVSYRGTLAQWSAALRRTSLLPVALAQVKLDKSPAWRLQTPRFVSTIPSGLLELNDKSPLILTMGFMNDGPKTLWDIQGAWWEKDQREDAAVGVWRRQRPPESAKLELRKHYDSIRMRRAPYDGTINRETTEIYSASKVIDVPGKKAGSVSADLEYGVTVRMIGHPSRMDFEQSTGQAITNTRVLEHGIGEDVASNEKAPTTPWEAAIDEMQGRALASADEISSRVGRDLRGRSMTQDLRDYFQSVLKSAATLRVDAPQEQIAAWTNDQQRRVNWLLTYWKQYPALTHNRDMWSEFLARNKMPASTPHNAEVGAAQNTLLAELARDSPNTLWAEDARLLREAFIKERNSLIRSGHMSVPPNIELKPRSLPCPAPASPDSDGKYPHIAPNADLRPLEDFWPKESKQLGEEGVVVVGIRVSATGCVTGSAIIGSSGSDMLDQAVLGYVESIPFVPAAAQGAGIESTVAMPVNFKLKN